MRAVPSPASSPAETTGDRPNRAQAATRKARARRMAMEALEPRALMAVAPLAPVFDPQSVNAASFAGLDSLRTISGGNVFDSSPTIAVNRYNPEKLVATWVTHNPAVSFPSVTANGAYSNDSGLTWSPIALPGARTDPSSPPTAPHAYNAISQPSVTFDGKDNFYVLEIQHTDDFKAGQVLVQPFNFSGLQPIAKALTQFPTFYQGGPAPAFANPQTAIRDAVIAADDNLASFTDPTTGAVQTDPGAGNIYIAWETNQEVPANYTGPFNPNIIQVLTSTNGGVSFSPPLDTGTSHFQNAEMDAAPRIAISQGTADGRVQGGQVTVLFDDFTSSRPVDVIRAARFTSTGGGLVFAGRSTVASTFLQGAQNAPYVGLPAFTTTGPQGIGPGAVIASDNTLGSFSGNQGRLYVAYTDYFDKTRFPAKGANNPADNTDIFMAVSDDGGASWQSLGKVNDDAAFTDGFSAAFDSRTYTTGRPQFQPQVAVDPATGTLALSYLDTRYDPARTRPVDSIQLSNDGGTTFSPSMHANLDLKAYDQTTQQYVSLGPVPENQVAQPDAGVGAIVGFGDRQGLAIYDGRLYAAFTSNDNGGYDTQTKTHIHVAPMLYGNGPRVVSSTMGQVSAKTVVDANGISQTFNNQIATDGTPLVDGFVVTFDRPVDAATFTRNDISVTYRDPFTSGSTPGIPEPITSDPIALNDGVSFLVRFPGQSNVGTYSYTVGPNLRDLTRNTLATNLWYADQSAGNLPALPPVGTGGSNVPAQDDAKSTLNIVGVPVNQGILDLDVLVSLQHPADGDLTLKLFPPTGYLPAGGPGYILLEQGIDPKIGIQIPDLTGPDLSDTTFDDQARTPIKLGAAPYTGHFRPKSFVPGSATLTGLGVVNGKSPNGTWILEIDDNVTGNAGKLLSWGLKVTTSNRSFDGKFTQAGVAAKSLTPGGGSVLSAGHLMDQNGDGLGGENPNTAGNGPPGSQPGSEVVGLTPGDIYAVPRPAPTAPEIFNGQNINPPFDGTTLPLVISGPHVVRSFVPGAQAKTADNLITDKTVPGFDFVFDRNMDPNSLTVGQHVARVATPYGTFAPGDRLPDGSTLVIQIVADPNSDPLNPNSDPDPFHPRTYQVQFFKQTLDPVTFLPVVTAFPQTQSGTYSVTLAADVQSQNGDPLDTNQNAGLDFLRGTPSAGSQPVTYTSQAAVPLAPSPTATTYTSVINVPASFLIKNVTLKLDIAFPQDNLLTAVLVAPDGFAVTLFSGVGNVGNGMNFTNTVLDDAAFTPIANGGPPFFGSFNPMQPLSQFKDHFSLGTWKLEVTVAANTTSAAGQITDWSLTLAQPLSNSGLGEPVADRATQSFRIFALDPANSLSSNSFTAVGPAGLGAKVRGGNAEVAGRVGAIAVDPSDASGNTVFVAGASGGIWKTSDFLTQDPAGPTYVPLTDNASTGALNIGSIAVFPRNNDPNQSIIFAATGDASVLGDEVRDTGGNSSPLANVEASQRGLGFLRSMDGGANWTLLDSRDNSLAFASRDHFFASIPGQAGVTSFKIAVDPKLAANGQVIVYAALADIDTNGQRVAAGPKGGLWKSLDTGKTWTQQRGGQATDLTLDLKSVNANSGNLDFLYAAFRGDGVYFSPNAGQNFDIMAGTTGNPLIQDSDPAQPQPVPVSALPSPNGAGGRIVLAKPALTGNDLTDKIYQGWLYAAVVNDTGGSQPVVSGGSKFAGLYLTKDFGQTWTLVKDTVLTANGAPWLPTNDTNNPLTPISGTTTKTGSPWSLGNFALSLAVDPNNANIVYLGGTDQFQATGLIRIDTTGIHDAHAFYLDDSALGGALHTPTTSGVQLASAGSGPYMTFPSSLDPITQPNINLIRDPGNPFSADATVLVHNTASFANDGGHVKQIQFDQAVAPNPFAPASDPWSIPTRDVHQIVTTFDPLTGKSRLLFATDQGIYTAVANSDGSLLGSIGDQRIVNGSRNGNLAIAEVYQGAAQPSQLAANVAAVRGFFYANTQDVGLAQSDPNILNKGTAGYGNLSGNIDTVNGANNYVVGPGGTVDRGTGKGLATQQTYSPTDAGTLYAYRISEDLVGLDGVGQVGRPSTDTVQVNTVGKTFGLYQTSNPGDTPDTQWQFRPGYKLIVNPLSANQMLISSQAGRVFATTSRGNIWSEIGNPSALDGTIAQALAYGAPDPAPPGGGLGALNNYILAGTQGGKVFVTFTAGGGAGNAWMPLSGGLDGSPVQMIATDPTRGSHDAYAVTLKGAYYIADTRGGTWQNITGNLFSVLRGQFNDPTLSAAPTLQYLSSIQVDYRYLIPDDFTKPAGTTHPMLYVAGQGGVFRSYDRGQNWTLFPDSAFNADGSANTASLLNSPLGNGGGLPNAQVTDLDLSLGNVDPTTGRPDVSTGPNILLASTFGRGQFAIRLAPIVFPNTAANSAILQLSTTKPTPPGTSDTGFFNTDGVTSSTTPVIEGLSEQSAFGNTVHVALFDVSTFSQAEINSLLAGTPTRLPTSIPVVAGTDATDATGRFAVQVAPGYFLAGTTDGPKRILVQAINGSGTKGNFAPLGKLLFNQFGATGATELGDPTAYSFILDTTPPVAPSAPILEAGSDSGLSQSDGITNVTANLKFDIALSAGEPATTHVYLVRDSDANVVDMQFGTAAPGTITLTDPGPVADGVHFYYAYEIDLAGNKGPNSAKLKVIIDTVAPARPNAPSLDPTKPAGGSDSGIVGDNITNVRQPFLTGTAEPGGLVQIIDSAGNVLGPALPTPIVPNVDPTNRRYSINPAAPLSDGTYVLSVREEDVAGNFSQPSAPITVQILSRTPATPTLALVAADDSGVVGDNVTNVTQPRLVGAATAGLAVKLVLDSGTLYDANGNLIPSGGTITATSPSGQPIFVAADGSYLVKFPRPLADGTYVVHSVVSDIAGNFAPSAPLTLTIAGGGVVNPPPTPIPGAPVLTLDPRDDSPPIGDNVTTNAQPRFDGKGATPGGTVQLVLNAGTIFDASGNPIPSGSVVGPPAGPAVIVAADGSFVVQIANRLTSGSYIFQALITSGGTTVKSSPLQIMITNRGLALPTLALSPADDTGIKGDNTTVVRRPRFVGIASYPDGSPAANVNLELDDAAGRLLALTTSSTTGGFVVSLPNDLGNGSITVVAKVRDVAGNPGPGSNPLTIQITSVPGDTNGDGTADLDSFGRGNSRFTLNNSTTNTTTISAGTNPAPYLTAFGDIPLTGDFDGDGKADYGFYRPSTAQWFLYESRAGFVVVPFGVPNQTVPVQADYDGDHVTDLATYNTSTNIWTIFQSKTGTTRTAFFGVKGDVPIPADYDGDGKADLAFFRPSTAQFYVSFSNGSVTNGGNLAFNPPNASIPLPNVTWGIPGDVPVAADYNGDNKIDVAIYRPRTGEWFVDFSAGGSQGIAFGTSTDIPVPADYDGDGRADFTLFRPTNPATPGQGNWLILGSASPGRIFAAGQANDVPLLAPLQYRMQTASVATRAIIGGPANAPTAAANLGSTALNFSGGTTLGAGKAASQTFTPPPAFASRRRPAQQHEAPMTNHHHAAANGHAHDAALDKLGHFKVKRHPIA